MTTITIKHGAMWCRRAAMLLGASAWLTACVDAPTAVKSTSVSRELAVEGTGSAGIATTWTLKDIGLFPGGTWSEAYGVGDNGWVVGAGDFDNVGCHHGGSPTAFVFKSNTLVDLGQSTPLPCSGSSVAYDVNKSGTAVGFYFNSVDKVAATWNSTGAYAVVATGCSDAVALGVNTSGAVVGWFSSCAGPTLGDRHPFVWTAAGGMVDALPAGHIKGEAVDITDSGVIVGTLDGKTATWTVGGPVTMIPGGTTTVGRSHFTITTWALGAANNVGFVGGDGSTSWRYRGGVFSSLPGGAATDISTKGRIVGWRTPGGLTAPVTRSGSGVVVPLATLGASGIGTATAVNTCGGIAGYSPPAALAQNHAVVWRISVCDP